MLVTTVNNLEHSFKNRTGPPVEPEKIGTRAFAGCLSALDRPASDLEKTG
jgi:hypothetical protein